MHNSLWVGGSIGRRGFPMLGIGKRGLSTYIKELFAKGEQGFAYDPNDLSTMFQDAAGTVPVTAVGQTVGLVLDKSKGLVLSEDKRTSGVVGKVGTSAINATYDTATGIGTVNRVSFPSEQSYIEFLNLVPNAIYKLTFSNIGGIFLNIRSGIYSDIGTTINSVNTVFVRASALGVITITAQANGTATFTLTSMCELKGNHVYQTTSAARPIFRQKPILGNELVVNGSFDTNLTGWQNVANSFAWTNGAAVSTGTQGDMVQDNLCAVGKTYLMSFNISGAGGAGVYVSVAGNDIAHYKNGSFTIITTATSTLKSIRFRIFSGNAATIDNVSLKEVTGYRTDQNYIEYDGVDDKLITNLPTQLTNCTVLRAIPNVGTQVKYNQTLPMLYEDSTNHSGLVAIDRALTRKEQLRLMDELDKRAGAVGFDTTTFKLFDGTKQGFWYDPSDLSTMYQDAAGTVPVTGAGQPVGLMLDKSKGLVLGSERAVNGDFSNGSANWNVSGADATHIVTFADGKVRYQSDTISPVLALNQGGAVVTGKWYEVTINCSSYVSGSLKIDAGNGAQVVVSGLGTFKTKILASNNVLTLVRNSPNVDLTIDSISVKELAGNHAYQTNAASRPLLQRNATTGAYYLAFDGTDDFLVTSSIDFTATDKVNLFAGVLKTVSGKVGAIFEFSSNPLNNYGTFGVYTDISPSIGGVATYSRGTATVSANVITTAMAIALNIQASISQKRVSNSINGKSVVSTQNQGEGNYGNYPIYIGRRGGSEFPFNGQIYSLIGVGRLTTDAETKAIEKELAKRTGVTLSV